MNKLITFDDVLIVPKFSTIKSRKDVNIGFSKFGFPHTDIPVISANMDTVTGEFMSKTMLALGAQACLHRFCTISDNVKMFEKSKLYMDGGHRQPMVSVGVGGVELERAEALVAAGAYNFIVDVAHGASIQVVEQAKELRKLFGDKISIVVGNFATGESVKTFLEHSGSVIDGVKVGIGPGSVCTTRIKTGIGYPQFSAILDISEAIKESGLLIIADGGMKTTGDIVKALGAGASMVMLGGMLAGTDESPLLSDLKTGHTDLEYNKFVNQVFKKRGVSYRGSASKESYVAQGKEASHRTDEGESLSVPYKGSVKDILKDIEGGIRSAFTYVGAKNLKEFHEKVEFVMVSSNTVLENGTRGGIK